MLKMKERKMAAEEMRWYGDGFNSGRDQVGRPVRVNGREGTVVDGSELFVTVCWSNWFKRLVRFLMFQAPCPFCGRYHR